MPGQINTGTSVEPGRMRNGQQERRREVLRIIEEKGSFLGLRQYFKSVCFSGAF